MCSDCFASVGAAACLPEIQVCGASYKDGAALAWWLLSQLAVLYNEAL